MVPALFILTLLLLWAVLLWAFVSFFHLVKMEIKHFPDEWKKDGQPFGAYLNRAGTHSYFRSGIASNWKMMQWLVKTPSWVHQSKRAASLLWQYRVLSWLYTSGIIFWFAILLSAIAL